MTRTQTCTKGIALACSALAFAMVGCSTSTTGETGGLEGQIILPGNDDAQLMDEITEIRAVLRCTGAVDPLTGVEMPTEIFDIDVSNTQNNDIYGTKPVLGVFKKEGLPIGAACEVVLTATTEDGFTECGGAGSIASIPSPPENGQIDIILNCITAARYGGLRVDGTFNRCMEFQQILVSPLTADAGTGTAQEPYGIITTDVWCYDPDTDDGHAAVYMVKADTFVQGNQSTWESCTPDPAPGDSNYCNPFAPGCTQQQQPYNGACNHIEPPITTTLGPDGNLVTPSFRADLECAEPAKCLVVVTVSDDLFAGLGQNPYGCDGFYPDDTPNDPTDNPPDYNAYSVIPVECEGQAICGNNILEPGEDCEFNGAAAEPPGPDVPPVFVSSNPVNTWCNSECEEIEPCTDGTTEEPWECPVIDTNCANFDGTCFDGENDTLSCSQNNINEAGPCDLSTPGGTANDGECESGTCVPIKVCTPGNPATCPAVECNTVVCDASSQCVYTPVADGTACDDGDDCTTGETCNTSQVCGGGSAVAEGTACDGDTGLCWTGSQAMSCRFGGCTVVATDYNVLTQNMGADWNDKVQYCANTYQDPTPGGTLDQCLTIPGYDSNAPNDLVVSLSCAECYGSGIVACTLSDGLSCLGDCAVDSGGDACRGCLWASPVECTPGIGYCSGFPTAPQMGPAGADPMDVQCTPFDFDLAQGAGNYNCAALPWTVPAGPF